MFPGAPLYARIESTFLDRANSPLAESRTHAPRSPFCASSATSLKKKPRGRGRRNTAVAFDIVALFSADTTWFTISFWMIATGIIGGLVAALPGFIDWLAIPHNTRARAIGAWHGGGSVVVLLLFIISWVMRNASHYVPTSGALVLSFVAVVLALATAWLGGELVGRLGVGDSAAHLDAPNSLSGRPASKHPQELRRAG